MTAGALTGNLAAVGLLGLHADHGAGGVGDKLGGGAVIEDLAAGVLIGLGEGHAELAAVAAGLAAAALDVVDAPGGQGGVDGLHVLDLDAPVHQPLDVLGGGVAEGADQVLVHNAVPVVAHEEVVHHVGGVGEILGLLGRGARAQNLAAAAGGGAAGDAGLLQHQDVGPRLPGGDGGRQAGRAGAHDDHVHVEGLVGGGALLHHGALQGLGVAAGLGDALSHGLLDGVAGDGGAGDAVHRQGLGLHDSGAHSLHGGGLQAVAQAVGLRVVLHLHVGDGGVVKGDGHGHLAVVALDGGLVGACLVAGGLGGLLPHGLVQALLDGGLDGVAGEGGAALRVHLGGLGVQDLGLHGVDGHAADALGLHGRVDLDVGDGGAADGDLHLHGAVHAQGLGGIGTGLVDRLGSGGLAGRLGRLRVVAAAGCQGEYHSPGQRKGQELLCVLHCAPPLVLSTSSKC